MRALIGHSGFVGRNLARQRRWDACFDRANIDAIRGLAFDEVVCAGLSSDRWQANGNPGGDRSNMLALASALTAVKAARFVLVSTIDVYPVPVAVDETTSVEAARREAYGEHRLEFERIVAGLFPGAHVLRLATPFGAASRRNVLTDLVRRRDLDAVDPRGVQQWYPLARLADDIDRVVRLGLPLANLCTEPVSNARLQRAYFDDLRIGGRPGPSVRQDVRSVHARALGGDAGYLMSADDVMLAIGDWLRCQAQFGEI